MTVKERNRTIEEIFDLFCSASSFETILGYFNELCDVAIYHPTKHWNYFEELSRNLKFYWKAAALFAKLEKRVKKSVQYKLTCRDINVLVVGCGPCGLRCAIELALLGARVIIVEKRQSFSRNNVLHLWPYLIEDLKALGAKTFFGKFCAGAIDHISIRTLQSILLKVALLFGVQVYPGVTYESLLHPESPICSTNSPDLKLINNDSNSSPIILKTSKHSVNCPSTNVISCSMNESSNNHDQINNNNNGDSTCTQDQSILLSVENDENSHSPLIISKMNQHRIEKIRRVGWRVRLKPEVQALKDYPINVLIGADGKRSCLGFPNKELRCRLAIAITANFVNYRTPDEAKVQEISGVARVFNQSFFARLAEDTGIDLENIVYYKDETHYFVMTAKKHSLLAKGVLKQDCDDSITLLNKDNVNKVALQAYAREAADYVTNGALPHLDFALNAYNEPDVDAFDFTRMFAAEHSCRILQQNQCLLLQCLIGDGLYEPFWPTGSGCALGFLSALDAAWCVSLLSSGVHPLKAIALRESVYQHLSQTTAQNMPPNFSEYTLDPMTRYPRCDLKLCSPNQVKHLYIVNPGIHLLNPTAFSSDKSDNFYNPSPDNAYQKLPTKIKSENGFSDYVKLSDLECHTHYWCIDEHFEQRDYLLSPLNNSLLRWFQIRLSSYVMQELCEPVLDFTNSVWDSGRNLLCLIHRYRPDLLLDIQKLKQPCQELTSPDNIWFKDNESRLEFATALLTQYFSADLYLYSNVLKENGHVQRFQTGIFPKIDTDWMRFLLAVYRVFCFVKLPNLKLFTSTKQTERVHKNRFRSHTPPVKKISNGPLTPRLTKLHEHSSELNIVKKNMNPVVEPSIPVKRLGEIITMLSDSSTALHSKGISTNPRKDGIRASKRNTGRRTSSPTIFMSTNLVKNVVREFAPHRTSSVCYICDKHLDSRERTQAFGHFFHRHCFRCSSCNHRLSEESGKCVHTENKAKFYCFAHCTKKINDKYNYCHNQYPFTRNNNNIDNNNSKTNVIVEKPISKAPKSASTASFVSRFQAGQFPFGSNVDKCPSDKRKSYNELDGVRKVSIERIDAKHKYMNSHNRNVGSSLLSDRIRESDRVVGVSDSHSHKKDPLNIVHCSSCTDTRRSRQKRKQISSSSTSSSSENYRNRHNDNRHRQHHLNISNSQHVRHCSSGIRCEPAPRPDCYPTEYLGLPEVVRRANLELNTSTIWSDTTLKQVLDHMRAIHPILVAGDEYFASSESESLPNLPDYIAPQTSRRKKPSTKVPISNNLSPNVSVGYEFVKLIDNVIDSKSLHQSDSVRPIEPSISAPTLCTAITSPTAANSTNYQPLTTVPFSSPTHQSRLAAKQRFCLEPPKPLTIDPLSFIAKRNAEHTMCGYIEDCSETVESISDLPILQANLFPLNHENDLVLIDLPSRVIDDSFKIPTDQSNVKQCEAITYLNGSIRISHSDSLHAFDVNDDIQDIDANSDTNSCCNKSTNNFNSLFYFHLSSSKATHSVSMRILHQTDGPFVSESRSLDLVPQLKGSNYLPENKLSLTCVKCSHPNRATIESDLDAELLGSESVKSNSSIGSFSCKAKIIRPYDHSIAYSDSHLEKASILSNFDNVDSDFDNSSSSADLISPVIIKPVQTRVQITHTED